VEAAGSAALEKRGRRGKNMGGKRREKCRSSRYLVLFKDVHLVGGAITILKNMSSSMGMMTSNI